MFVVYGCVPLSTCPYGADIGHFLIWELTLVPSNVRETIGKVNKHYYNDNYDDNDFNVIFMTLDALCVMWHYEVCGT